MVPKQAPQLAHGTLHILCFLQLAHTLMTNAACRSAHMYSPCRAGACAGAEVRSNHLLATLTVEPFHRMQFRSGTLLGPIFHAGPKTCALAFPFPFQSPVPYLSCMHLWVSYTRSIHYISVNWVVPAPALAPTPRSIIITI